MDDIHIGNAKEATGESHVGSPLLDALLHPFSSMTSTCDQIYEIIHGQQALQDEITALRQRTPIIIREAQAATEPHQAAPPESDNESSGVSLSLTPSDGDEADDNTDEGGAFPLAAVPRHSGNLQRGQPIFANDFFEIRASPVGGLGAFAVRDLQRGDRILTERAVIRAIDVDRDLIRRFDALSLADRDLVLDLAMHKPRHLDGDESLHTRVKAIFTTNYFACTSEAPGHGLFLVASRFNHACRPKMNVEYAFHRELDALAFTVAAPHGVRAGQELTINYGKDAASLCAVYGFECACGGDCDLFRRRQAAREWGTSAW
ncbi:hypothetical protein ACHAQA_000542 [Verticillium albo-atrum]